MLFEGAQLGGRLEAELVQRRARVAVGGEGVRLSAGAVEAEDLLRAESFSVWVVGDEGVELGGERCVVAVGEVEVDARLERAEAGVVEACGLGAAKGSPARSASAGPRQSASARRGSWSATSCSKRWASSSPSSTRRR